MAAPIIKIPVDDDAFQRFLQAFKKYQSQVEDQPDIWNDVNDSVKDLVSTSSDLAASIDKQLDATKKLAEEEDKRDRKLQDAARRRKQEDDDFRRRDEETARRRKEAIQQVKGYAANAGSAASNLGSWASGGGHIGELAQGAAGAVGTGAEALSGLAGGIVSGIGSVIAGVLAGVGVAATVAYGVNKYGANMYRRAGGMGVSPGELEGGEIYSQRYYDVDQAMSSMAIMQRTPQAWSTFGLLGLNPRGANTAKLTNEAVLRARSLFIKQGQNLDLAGREGLTSFLSPDALIRLAGTSEKELKASIAKGEDFSKKYGITKSTGDAATDFVNAMDASTAAIKNTFINGLGDLDPKLSQCVELFGKLADDLKTIVPFMDKIAGFFGGPSPPPAPDLSTPKLSNDIYDKIVNLGEHGAQGQISPKGAMGMSQLMPETAKSAAKMAGVPFDLQILNAKTPEGQAYNQLLGRTWTRHLANTFAGDQALIAAAYNAGEGSVKKKTGVYWWLKEFGDPRTGKISDLEWAKKIPIRETHDYLMRVLGHPELQNAKAKSTPTKKASDYRPVKVHLKVSTAGGGTNTHLARNASG